MRARVGRCFFSFLFLIALIPKGDAQTTPTTPGQILIDMGATAGSTAAPWWANGLAAVANFGTDYRLISQGDYLGVTQRAVDWGTVKAATVAGLQLGGPGGGAFAAGITQGALDVGQYIVAPQIANWLVARFPGAFIPPEINGPVHGNPFGNAQVSTPNTQSVITTIGGTSSSSSASAAKLTEIGVGPATQINTFGGPVLIGEPALIGPIGKAAQVGSAIQIGSASTNTGSVSGPASSSNVVTAIPGSASKAIQQSNELGGGSPTEVKTLGGPVSGAQPAQPTAPNLSVPAKTGAQAMSSEFKAHLLLQIGLPQLSRAPRQLSVLPHTSHQTQAEFYLLKLRLSGFLLI